MWKNISKLIDVKSIVTFAMVGVYWYLAVFEKIDLKGYENMVLMIVAFYFGTQYAKKD